MKNSLSAKLFFFFNNNSKSTFLSRFPQSHFTCTIFHDVLRHHLYWSGTMKKEKKGDIEITDNVCIITRCCEKPRVICAKAHYHFPINCQRRFRAHDTLETSSMRFVQLRKKFHSRKYNIIPRPRQLSSIFASQKRANDDKKSAWLRVVNTRR